MHKIQPVASYILVRLHLPNPDGGIVLPDTYEPDEPHGEVLAIGPSVTNVAVGDRIGYDPTRAISIKHEDEKAWLVYESAVMFKLLPCENALPISL